MVLSHENINLKDQLLVKTTELQRLKQREENVRKEVENNREKMRRYLSDRDKWEEEVKSVISEIGQHKQSESNIA